MSAKRQLMMPRKQRNSSPTIQNVADLAGVSPATVSRVLNNFPHISDEVRRQVLAAIKHLNYEPNRVAQRLRATHSRLIGIVVTDITNPFFNTIMASIEAVFFDQGFSVLMSNTTAIPRKELDYLSMMENEEIAGLIIAPSSENVDRVAEMAEAGLPIVVLDRRMSNAHVDVVLADNVGGARSAIDHLVRLGHTRIGHIGGRMPLSSGRERYEGYKQAMDKHGLPISDGWVRFGDHKHASGYVRALELLDEDDPPTAWFVANNMMTLGALNAIHDRGKNIPDDIAIVGFDDMPWAISLNPPLTAVAQPTLEIGHRAAKMLLERIEQPDLAPRVAILDTKLIVRASCGARVKDKRRKEVLSSEGDFPPT
jgi:LacI family transcriptional regulator/LacI family repressor for deo operon, udp, cdd, tsx, nupC, and nupG